MIRAFLFALDGVIVNTTKFHYFAWKKLADELNLKFDIQDNELLKGVSRRKAFETIGKLNHVSYEESEIEQYCAQKNHYYLEYMNQLRNEDISPGVKEFVEKAKEDRYLIGLGSQSNNSQLILERLGIRNLFDVIIDGTKVIQEKPEPDIFLRGSEELGVPAESCIVFEDSIAGIMAAHNGNMKAIGVANTEVKTFSDYFIDGFQNVDHRILIKKVAGQ